MHVKTGDLVIVRSGEYKGKTGKVIKALPKLSLVLVEGVNIKKRHQKARRSNQKGQIIEKHLPVHASKVMKADVAKERAAARKKK